MLSLPFVSKIQVYSFSNYHFNKQTLWIGLKIILQKVIVIQIQAFDRLMAVVEDRERMLHVSVHTEAIIKKHQVTVVVLFIRHFNDSARAKITGGEVLLGVSCFITTLAY